MHKLKKNLRLTFKYFNDYMGHYGAFARSPITEYSEINDKLSKDYNQIQIYISKLDPKLLVFLEEVVASLEVEVNLKRFMLSKLSPSYVFQNQAFNNFQVNIQQLKGLAHEASLSSLKAESIKRTANALAGSVESWALNLNDPSRDRLKQSLSSLYKQEAMKSSDIHEFIKKAQYFDTILNEFFDEYVYKANKEYKPELLNNFKNSTLERIKKDIKDLNSVIMDFEAEVMLLDRE